MTHFALFRDVWTDFLAVAKQQGGAGSDNVEMSWFPNALGNSALALLGAQGLLLGITHAPY